MTGLRSPTLTTILGVIAAAVAWTLIVARADLLKPFATAQEALCYWLPSLADPYRLSDWTKPIAYVYSPAFLQLISPIAALPWHTFVGVWIAILLAALWFLVGPRLFWLSVLAAGPELIGGNISLLLAVAIVVGFRYPATWAFVLLTKVTPGIGLIWFVVRGEWRQLGLALAATALVVAVSAVFLPHAWPQWVDVLLRSTGRAGTSAALPIPLMVRLPIAALLVAWGGRTNRRWTVPVASMIALPALWYGSLSMLLAVIAVGRFEDRDEESEGTQSGGTASNGEPRPQRAPSFRTAPGPALG